MEFYGKDIILTVVIYLTVHRIGRTGRCGKTGIATTFINKVCGKFDIFWLD